MKTSFPLGIVSGTYTTLLTSMVLPFSTPLDLRLIRCCNYPLFNFEEGIQKGLFNSESSEMASFSRQMILMAGFAVDSRHNDLKSKTV